MLQQMRSFAKSWVASAFLLVVVGSFTLWGVADVFRGHVDTDVATVGSTDIPQTTFARDYRNLVTNQSQRLRQDITPEMARKMGLGEALLKDMVQRSALDTVVDDLGLVVSDSDVTEAIRNMTSFNGPLGRFDKTTFQTVLRQRNYGEDEFVELIRKEMARAQLLAPVQGGFSVPPGYAHALFSYSTELRATQYVILTPQALGPIAPPSDQVLAAYVKARPAQFSTPEYRAVSFAYIAPADVSTGIKITDDQLHKQYDADKAIYVVPEQRNVEQVAFADEASAKTARAKIDGGKSFAEMAREAGKTIDDRGSVTQSKLGALGAPAFALTEGGVSAPVQYFASWVLVHVTKITAGKTTTFDDAKAELAKKLTDLTAQSKIVDISNVYQEQIGDGAEVAEAARKAGMKFGRVPAVDARGLAPDGTKAALPVADADLVAHVFDAEAGEPTDPFTTASGYTYAINVDGVTPPKMKAFAAVRAQAIAMWTKEQAATILKKRAAQLAAQAQREHTLAGIARTLGAPVLSGSSLTHDGENDIFSAELVDSIFSVPAFNVVSGPLGKGDGYVIAQVTGVIHPPLPPASPGYRQGLNQVANQIGEDVTILMANEVKAKLKVRINQKLVDQAIGGSGEGQ